MSCTRHWHKIGCYKQMESTLILDDRPPSQNHFNEFYSKGYLTDVNHFDKSTHSLACRCARLAKEKGFRYFSLRFWGMCHGIRTETVLESLDEPATSTSLNCASCKQSKGQLKSCDPNVDDECLGMFTFIIY